MLAWFDIDFILSPNFSKLIKFVTVLLFLTLKINNVFEISKI